jgi:BlaI family penicillinase repressor
MNTNNKILTQPEWYLMEPLWKHHRQTGREAVEYLKESVGWSRSTSLTMLRRMTEKGYVRCVEENGLFVYYPLIRREEAALQETESFLNRVYNGSVSTFMSAFTKKQKLSKTEIDELYSIIRQAEEELHE